MSLPPVFVTRRGLHGLFFFDIRLPATAHK
jgi:hypothetical protein